jgi:endonuclease/exonuclease/phosphatase family metal-dependent hydrolase
MRYRATWSASILAAVLALGACTSDAPGSEPSAPSIGSTGAPVSPQTAPVRLKVMTFNIEYGGTVIDFDSVIAAIRKSHADVVGINEPQDNVPKIAKALGWPDVSTRLSVVSKFPLIDPPGADGSYIYVEVAPGHVVAIANLHLPSGPYGPRRILDGESKKDAMLAEQQVRVPPLQQALIPLTQPTKSGIPTFVLGDFNAPSRYDWTPPMVGIRPQIRYPFAWPTSETMHAAGFTDSYRSVHTDPMTDPGLTWPSGRPHAPDSWNPRRDAPQDRIDFVYSAGPAMAVKSQVVGEPGGSDISVSPWPSDHRAVLSTFDVKPAVMPTLVAVDHRLVDVGDPLVLTYHASGQQGEKVVLVTEGSDPSTDGILEQPTVKGATDGRLTFATGALAAGAYDAVLMGAEGKELSASPFWTKEPGTGPSLATDRRSYAPGDRIGVTWKNMPGNRFDWVAVYRRGASPAKASYLNWFYTDSTVDGSGTFDEMSSGRWPLRPGKYSAYLLADDDYQVVGSTAFTIHG